MTSSTPSLWIVELGEGRAHVHLAGIAHLSVPVVELQAGDSYKGIPYEVWAPHLGETVDVATLERESVPHVSATSVDDTEVDELVARLRRRAGCLFAIPAVVGTLWVLQAWAAYPYWGYTGIVTLYYLIILVPLVLVWCRITWLMLAPRRTATLSGSILGWVHIAVGVALVLFGLRGASDADAGASGGAYLGNLILCGFGAVFFEGGRSYVRVWRAQEHAAGARSTTGLASAE